ncbi:hypothetical protein FB45DRAFT_938830, partial [Roridomyces roridus]
MSFVRTPNFAQPRPRVRSASVSAASSPSFFVRLTKPRRLSWPFFTPPSEEPKLHPIVSTSSTSRPRVSPHRPALKRRPSGDLQTIELTVPKTPKPCGRMQRVKQALGLKRRSPPTKRRKFEILPRVEYTHTPLACEVDLDLDSESDSSESSDSDDEQTPRCRKLRFDLTPEEARLNEEKAARKKSKQMMSIAQKEALAQSQGLEQERDDEEYCEPSWADF